LKSELVEPFVADSALILRGDPRYPEHDDWGFRNDSVPAGADIVALGDSHTYGTSVSPDDAWPRQLAAMTGRRVHNLGLPTWGPLQYEAMLPRALELAPERIVLALYLGNDLFDAFVAARRRGTLEAITPPDEWAEVTRLEAAGPIEAEARRLFRAGDPEPAETTPATSGLRDLLSDHSRLYGVLRTGRGLLRPPPGQSALMAPDFDRAASAVTDERAAFVAVHDGPEWRALLSPSYRHRVLDLRDPRIRIGFEITVGALGRMAAALEASGTEFVVVLLPTKEAVFAPRMRGATDHPELPRLWAAEDEVRTRLLEALAHEGVAAMDLRPALAEAMEQPYFENIDGHLNAAGHRVVARELARRWGR
jgi:hypothetical protein